MNTIPNLANHPVSELRQSMAKDAIGTFLWLMLIVLCGILVYSIRFGYTLWDASTVLLGVALTLINLITLKSWQKHILVIRTSLVSIMLVLWVGLTLNSLDGFVLFWLYFFPGLSFLLEGKKTGTLWSKSYVLGIILIFFLGQINIFPSNFSFQTSISVIASLVFTTYLSRLASTLQHNYRLKTTDLIKGQEQFKQAVNSSTNHIIITDINGVIVYANQAAEQTTGFSFAEMEGQTPRLWGGLMSMDFYHLFWDTIKNKRQPFSGEITNLRKDGTIYTAFARVSPIIDSSQQLLGFIGTEEDITERITLQQQLKQQLDQAILKKAQDEAILQSIGDALVVLDKNGLVIMTNQITHHLLGYTEADLIGKPFSSIVTATTTEGLPIDEGHRPLYLAIQQAEPVSQTLVYRTKSGNKLVVHITLTPVQIDDDSQGVVLVFRDVSQEQAIDKMKTEFISLASHQLRTPLSTINWYLELLLGGDAGEISAEQRKFLDEAYTDSKRLVKLVSALLDVSRIELGTFAIEPEPTDIVKLTRSVLDEEKPLIDEKKLTVTLTKQDIPLIPLDPDITRIILQNVITNAVKYTPDDKEIQIDLKIVAQGQVIQQESILTDCLLITVVDQGIGIPDYQQAEIFNKLFRADNARKSDTEGTGLGLYIIKSIVEQAGGKIWFESIENQGTTFWVTIPLAGMTKKAGPKKLGS